MDSPRQKCPYVHYVEFDFIPGVYPLHPFDTVHPKSMFGGLAVALMRPKRRPEDLIVHQSQAGLFETVLKPSCHVESRVARDLLRRAKTKLFSWDRRGFCAPTPRWRESVEIAVMDSCIYRKGAAGDESPQIQEGSSVRRNRRLPLSVGNQLTWLMTMGLSIEGLSLVRFSVVASDFI